MTLNRHLYKRCTMLHGYGRELKTGWHKRCARSSRCVTVGIYCVYTYIVFICSFLWWRSGEQRFIGLPSRKPDRDKCAYLDVDAHLRCLCIRNVSWLQERHHNKRQLTSDAQRHTLTFFWVDMLYALWGASLRDQLPPLVNSGNPGTDH